MTPRIRHHFLRAACVVSFALLLTGCGFQLKGLGVASSLERVSLGVADAYGPFDAALREVLGGAGVEVVDAGAAPLHIELSGERNTRRALSSSSRLRVAEYELNLEVTLRVLDPQGGVLIPATPLTLARTFSFDPNSLQANSEEEQKVRAEMRRELASRILRRVESQSRREPL